MHTGNRNNPTSKCDDHLWWQCQLLHNTEWYFPHISMGNQDQRYRTLDERSEWWCLQRCHYGYLTITEATSAMNGYQYRVVFAGGCSANDATNVATPLPLVHYRLWLTQPQQRSATAVLRQFSITNTASAPVTSTYSSGSTGLIYLIIRLMA